MMKSRTILFYSSVSSKRQFSTQGFYRTDIKLLRQMGFAVRLSNSCFDFLQFWRYDTGYIYFYRYGLIPAILARLFGKTVFFTGGIDDLDLNYAGWKSYFIQVILFNLCTFFSNKNIIVSQADMDNCHKIDIIYKNRKNTLVPHSIDLHHYLIKNYKQRKKLVTTIARMSWTENVIRKGVLESVELFSALHELDPEFSMKIVGALGEGTELVVQKIADLNLEGCVELTGELLETKKVELLQSSMFYFQLSKYEGFGIAAIEALASGNLVVHSNEGGLSEAVGDYGLIFDGNVKGCAKYLHKTSKSLASLETYAERGRDGVRLKFSNDMRYAGLAKIIDEPIG